MEMMESELAHKRKVELEQIKSVASVQHTVIEVYEMQLCLHDKVFVF